MLIAQPPPRPRIITETYITKSRRNAGTAMDVPFLAMGAEFHHRDLATRRP